MLIYDYKCPDCSLTAEHLVEDNSVKSVACTECGGASQRVFPAPAWKFKRGQESSSAIATWQAKRESHIAWERKHLKQGEE